MTISADGNTEVTLSSAIRGRVSASASVQQTAVHKLEAVRDWFHHEELFTDKVSSTFDARMPDVELFDCMCCTCCTPGFHKRGLGLSQVLATPPPRGVCFHPCPSFFRMACVLLPGRVLSSLLIRSMG